MAGVQTYAFVAGALAGGDAAEEGSGQDVGDLNHGEKSDGPVLERANAA
jgi:hypothetical protein